ncbi:MAG: NAD(P)-dependent glycerol-3-phosphate dehydrogenase [Deltaproteobacteria bacterium]|nr:NAD(P)-dependent glycerol-3-phosphate dehydrogenase [Deltaproteobacteria bacterium]
MNILVLSAGVWGTTLAALLGSKGHRIRVWEFDPAVVEAIRKTGHHPRLAHLDMPPTLEVTTDMAHGLEDAEIIVCVAPAEHVRATLSQLAGLGYNGQPVIMASKGIERGTHALMADVARQALGEKSDGKICLLSGPTIAFEVSKGMPTVITATAVDIALAQQVQKLFRTPRFRVYTQTDMVGVEIASALKNVVAIACGIIDGLGFGSNSKAGLITRGLWEIVRLGVSLGARQETFFGIAGMGDLVVTCTSPDSRNRSFGELIGKGMRVQEALKQIGMVVEGFYSVQAALDLAAEKGVELPIIQAVSEVTQGRMTPLEAVNSLMLREAKGETEL